MDLQRLGQYGQIILFSITRPAPKVFSSIAKKNTLYRKQLTTNFAIGKPEWHVRKASHCGSKQP